MTTHSHQKKIRLHEKLDNSKRIAVIDDEQKWLKVFKRMFRNSGYTVDTFVDPRQFLLTIAAHPQRYAGIICDIKMPQMDGYQAYEAIKNNKATCNIPFLIVSGVLTQDHNLAKVQGVPYVSKLDDNLRGKVFEELIEVIENWPNVRAYLHSKNITEDKINFFCRFFINYHKYFKEILTYVNKMEMACVDADEVSMARIGAQCNRYMSELQDSCMDIISLIQEYPDTTHFIRKVCERGRTSLTMIQSFQLLLAEHASSKEEFRVFLQDCRDQLEKIIIGSEKGYNLRRSGGSIPTCDTSIRDRPCHICVDRESGGNV